MGERSHAVIVAAYQWGIGDELAHLGYLINRLIEGDWGVTIYTFHEHLYRHPRIEAQRWPEAVDEGWTPPAATLGVCVYAKTPNLPLEFDRSPLVAGPCKEAGWVMLDEHMSGLESERQGSYDFGRALAVKCGVGAAPPPFHFLGREAHDDILLNLFGGGDLKKGMDTVSGWRTAYAVAARMPQKAFAIVRLPHQAPPPDELGVAPVNLWIWSCEYGDPRVTALYIGAPALVTVEGGGYHLAYASDIPAMLVTSEAWFRQVASYALPPLKHSIAWIPEEAELWDMVADDIVSWLRAQELP